MLTVDRRHYLRELPHWLAGLARAAHGKPIRILALSGGGGASAFGAGALVGLAKADARPQYQLVTGVSGGALLAPFAFLGPGWDPELRKAFTGDGLESLRHAGMFRRLLRPATSPDDNPLAELVDHDISDAMIDAVGREAETGRMLIVATTDLDDQQTMFWNMGAIAEHGGPAAHALFRKVLIASASVPGMFPPVLIRVREHGKTYEEMHVDGGVTTPLFIAPLIGETTPANTPQLKGAEVYAIINQHLAIPPKETPVNTIKILQHSVSAALTSKMRDALAEVMAVAQRNHMHFHFTNLPLAYPAGNFLDFHRKHLERLFHYGETCAARGLLWTSPQQAIRRDFYSDPDPSDVRTACPATVSGTTADRPD